MDSQGHEPTQGQNRNFHPAAPPWPQLPQPGNQLFHPMPGAIPYSQGPPSAPYQGPPQPYSTHPRAPHAHVSSQASHSYLNSDRQSMAWNQNVNQRPPPPLAPIPSSGAYPLHSSQGYLTQPQPPLPSVSPHSSNSGSLNSNTTGSSFQSMQQHAFLPPMGSLPPPPPPRLPPPPPPLPPSYNSHVIEDSGHQRFKMESSDDGISMLEDASYMKASGDRTVTQIDVLKQCAEKNELRDAENDVVSHSPADSDIDMEDDITQLDEENQNRLFKNLDGPYASTCQDDVPLLEQARGDIIPSAEDGNSLFSESAPFEIPRRGFNVQPDCDVTASRKVYSETDNSESPNISNIEAPQPKNTSTNPGNDNSDALKPEQENGSPKLKLDEFGRLVRGGDTDSDASESPRYARRYARRDNRKRSRSRSRSRSPYSRRSPRRRKERRGRSRSFSPKRRRSRSRSPLSRRGNELVSEKSRGEKNQLQQCFDFLRGKCYRGATCRYSHHEPDKSERLRYNRGKQHYRDVSPPSWGKELPDEKVKDKGTRLPKEVKDHAVEPMTPNKSSSLGSKSLQTSKVSVYSDYSMPLGGGEDSLVREYPVQYIDSSQQGKRMNDYLLSESSLVQASSVTFSSDKADLKQNVTGQVHSIETTPLTKSYSGAVASQSLKVSSASTADHMSQFTPLPSVSQVVNAPFMPPMKQDYDTMSPDVRFHDTPQNYSSYQAPLAYHHSHYTGPSNSSSTTLLPQPPLQVNSHSALPVKTELHSTSLQHMQQSSLLQWNGLPPNASVGASQNEFQLGQYQAYAAAREPNQLPESMNDKISRNMHMSDRMSQHDDPHTKRDLLIGYTGQSVNPSTSLGQTQSNLSYNEKLSSPVTSVAPGIAETNQSSYIHGLDGSRTSSHFNLYSSTFDQPMSSKFISSSSVQENATQLATKYDSGFGSSGDVRDVGNGSASENVKILTSSVPADPPRPIDDEYDPFFDSIEPASNSFVEANHRQYEATGDSDSVRRYDGSGVMLNMDNINREGGIALSENSLLKEEFGETADAELGAVMSESLSAPNIEADINAREIEIDQVKSSGKNKGKEAKSMKLFKTSIAAFVKEILKPSWRQGNMSKEAFKTIVKKTVDKVSGAMKGRHVPKSQSNINRYIDSSRGKLTKLVMGYVDKYVKV